MLARFGGPGSSYSVAGKQHRQARWIKSRLDVCCRPTTFTPSSPSVRCLGEYTGDGLPRFAIWTNDRRTRGAIPSEPSPANHSPRGTVRHLRPARARNVTRFVGWRRTRSHEWQCGARGAKRCSWQRPHGLSWSHEAWNPSARSYRAIHASPPVAGRSAAGLRNRLSRSYRRPDSGVAGRSAPDLKNRPARSCRRTALCGPRAAARKRSRAGTR